MLAGCKKKYDVQCTYECLSIFLTSIFMSDLLLHLFKTFLLNFLTTQFLQIHPSIKAKNSLPSIPFCGMKKKNHIRLKIMASRYIFLFLRNYLCTTTLPINRKKKRPDINQQKKKWQLEQLSTPQHRKIGLGRKRAQQQFFLPQLLSSILCCPFPFFTVMYG